MKKIAIITARAGSKGLANKNVLLVDGKPLIAYTIEAALASCQFAKIIVSTDSQEYIDLLAHYPIEFIKRAAHLSADNASSFVVIEDVLKQYAHTPFDYFVLLQPTSPLRTAQHIQQACLQFEQQIADFDFLVSVSEAHKPTALTRVIDEDNTLKHFQLDYSNYSRQQYHKEYSPNGAIFIAKPQPYLSQKHFYGAKSLAYFMDKAVSIDIDDQQDFDYFCFLQQQQHKAALQLQQINQQIKYKACRFNQNAELSLIGHSILDQWDIQSLAGLRVNNLAISGISTEQYLGLILEKGLIRTLANKIILMIGVNDMIQPNWTGEAVANNIQQLILALKAINPQAVIYFLEITPIAFRNNLNNESIRQLNALLKKQLSHINWVNLAPYFSDQYGKLDSQYSTDGLHFNPKGYQLLTQILTQTLQA